MHKIILKILSILTTMCMLLTSQSALVFAEELTSRTAFQNPAFMPFSFYVGKVQREYKETGVHELKTVDLNDYIELKGDGTVKTVTSLNGQTTLDNENGSLVINADKAQGLTGYMENAPTDFKDVIIESQNEYGAFMVVSMDDKPIKTSNRVLIQSMTEEKTHGFETEQITEARNPGIHEPDNPSDNDRELIEKTKITDMGADLMQVLDIKASVTFKGIENGYAAALDENGYVREILEPVLENGNLRINIPRDAIYVVYSRSEITKPEEKEREQTYVWWEAEERERRNGSNQNPNPNIISHNFPNNGFGWLSNSASEAGKLSLLSGNQWLSCNNGDNQTPYERYAEYKINVPRDGEYAFYVRKAWSYGPFRWRFDNTGEWRYCTGGESHLESVDLVQYFPAVWVYLGEVELTAGQHTFRFELSGDNSSAAIDCFMLSYEPFIPNGKYKPDDNKPNPETGYFAFDPQYDEFTSEAALNLRCLNEGYAGQDGFVTTAVAKDGSGYFKLGNGEEVRFWGVNAGPAIISSDKKTVTYLAKSLAKRGVNLVRMHGTIFRVENKQPVFDLEYLDQIHYFIAAMKEQGIYVSISLYFPLWFNFEKTNSGFNEYHTQGAEFPFALLQFNEEFQNIYKAGLKKLFETENPYTKVALKDEAAVHSFEIQNEDNYFFWTFKPANIPNTYLYQLEKMFGDWLLEKYSIPNLNSLTNSGGPWHNNGGSNSRDRFLNGRAGLQDAGAMTGESWAPRNQRIYDQIQFLTEQQMGFYQNIYNYMRNDLKSKSLIIPGNWTTADPTILEAIDRYTYDIGDIIDRHGYFEPALHQSDPEDTNLGATQGHAVRVGDRYIDRTGLTMMDSVPLKYVQHAGKPYMQSEIGWTNPNRFRAEFPIAYSAYASLQGIDLPVLFTINPNFIKTIGKFTLSSPVGLGQFPAAALMYRNGYVEETEPVVLETLNINELYKKVPSFINEGQNLDEVRKVD